MQEAGLSAVGVTELHVPIVLGTGVADTVEFMKPTGFAQRLLQGVDGPTMSRVTGKHGERSSRISTPATSRCGRRVARHCLPGPIEPSMNVKDQVLRRVVSQFHRPHGVGGYLADWVMAHRSSNREHNRWVVSLLSMQPTDRVLKIGFGHHMTAWMAHLSP
jgi:hypothetical protein